MPPTTGTKGLDRMSGGPWYPFRVMLHGCIAHDFIQKERSARAPPWPLKSPIDRTQALSSSLTSGMPFGLFPNAAQRVPYLADQFDAQPVGLPLVSGGRLVQVRLSLG